jgi:hypothetical protein
LASALFFQVIQEAQDGLAVPISEGLLTGRVAALALDKGQQ